MIPSAKSRESDRGYEEILKVCKSFRGFPGSSEVKCLPAVRETWVQTLGREDPLEKEMATHSSTLAWKIPWMEEPGRLHSMASKSRIQLSDFVLVLGKSFRE